MVKVWYDKDVDFSVIKDRKVAVIGYGSQGRGQSLNIRDSGVDTVVGLRKGSPSWKRAEEEGMKVMEIEEAVEWADIVQILIPDTVQPQVYREKIAPHLKEGMALVFSHGFNIHFRQIVPPEYIDVYMVAPKGPGNMVRQLYEEGKGVPSLIAVHQDYTGKAKELALAHAVAIGSGRAAILETTFAEETETDLFGEQVVLCGGVTSLIKAGFETLVEAGYQPEVAYFEVLHELKLIVDLIYSSGIYGMRKAISDTAKYGDLTRGPRVINEESRKEMKKILEEIQSGKFATEWILENQAGRPRFYALLEKDRNHLIEKVGEKLRSMIPWIVNKK